MKLKIFHTTILFCCIFQNYYLDLKLSKNNESLLRINFINFSKSDLNILQEHILFYKCLKLEFDMNCYKHEKLQKFGRFINFHRFLSCYTRTSNLKFVFKQKSKNYSSGYEK